MISNVVNTYIYLNKIVTIKNGFNRGIVMLNNKSRNPAPSISAASYILLDIEFKPRYKINVTKGVHCHKSTRIMLGITEYFPWSHN